MPQLFGECRTEFSTNRRWPSIQRYLDLRHHQKVIDNSGLYHYASNNPVRYIDPDGRTTIVDENDNHVKDVIIDGDTSVLAYPYQMGFTDFQKGAGALQEKGLMGVLAYKLYGIAFGDPPYYGENYYQYRCSLTGYIQVITGNFKPVFDSFLGK